MSAITVASVEPFQSFPDAERARLYLESRRWPDGPACPHCGSAGRIMARKGRRTGFYRCHDCGDEFTVRTRTIFERSHVPLHKWVHALQLVATKGEAVSSTQLAKEIGVTQKTAWLMLGRIREALGGDDPTKLGSSDEVLPAGVTQQEFLG